MISTVETERDKRRDEQLVKGEDSSHRPRRMGAVHLSLVIDVPGIGCEDDR